MQNISDPLKKNPKLSVLLFFCAGAAADNPLYYNVSANTVCSIILTLLDVSSFPSELYYATVKIATGREFYDFCGKGCGATETNKEWVSYKIIHLPPSGPCSLFLLSSANFCCRAECRCQARGRISAVPDTFPHRSSL